MSTIVEVILGITQKLREDQEANGSWSYPFETGVSTDAYMIILLRTLEIHDEELIRELKERILSRQEENGAWKLFADEEGEGNLTATVECYYSLLYSRLLDDKDERMQKAKRFILANGGLEKSHMFTKIMLSLTGQYPWPAFFPIPVEFILLPLSFPINFFDFSVFGRANLAPIMILSSEKLSIKTELSPDLTDLFVSRADDFFDWRENRDTKKFFQIIESGIKLLIGLPHTIHSMAIQRAKQYILNHLETDGTFYNYFSATFLMIFALLSQGHKKDDPIILRAVAGLKSMNCKIDGHTHIQYTTASVWNTSLISYALQNAGVPSDDPMVIKANNYLLSRQHKKHGDWIIHNPGVSPGGWGFSDINTFNPDIDDTTASLRAFSKVRKNNDAFHRSWHKGIRWLYTMQNDDGGFPSFEKNTDNPLLNLLPIEGARFLISDSSSADLTGRTLEFIGHYSDYTKSKQRIVHRAIKWLIKDQEENGSWYGRWGICYIYGTWAAVTGLVATGVPTNHPSIKRAVNWLKDIQNEDGGWGESCKSDIKNTYVPLGESTLTHSSWALDALISASNSPTPEIMKGVNYLIASINKRDWTEDYPVGQGMGGAFYIHYHSYRYIFPLLALSHYLSKFENY